MAAPRRLTPVIPTAAAVAPPAKANGVLALNMVPILSVI